MKLNKIDWIGIIPVILIAGISVAAISGVRECSKKREREEPDLVLRDDAPKKPNPLQQREATLDDEIEYYLSGSGGVALHGNTLESHENSISAAASRSHKIFLLSLQPSDDPKYVHRVLEEVAPEKDPKGWVSPSSITPHVTFDRVLWPVDADTSEVGNFSRPESSDFTKAEWIFDSMVGNSGKVDVVVDINSRELILKCSWKRVKSDSLVIFSHENGEDKFVALMIEGSAEKKLSEESEIWRFARIVAINHFARSSIARYERFIVVRRK